MKIYLFIIMLVVLASFCYADANPNIIDGCVISHWGFSTNADDDGNASNDGIVDGATHNTTGCYINNCYTFDGTNDKIDLTNDDTPYFAYSTGTMCQAVRYPDTTHNDLYSVNFQKDGDELLGFGSITNGKATGIVRNADIHYFDFADSLNNGQWHYICMVQRGFSLELWVDGKNQTLTMLGGSRLVAHWWHTEAGNYEVAFGMRAVDIDIPIKGNLDEIFFCNRPLNKSEIEYVNQSESGYPFAVLDSTPPVISLVQPTNESHVKNDSVLVIINISESGYCDINLTGFSKVFDNGTLFKWQRLATPEGNYSGILNCSDLSSNTDNASFWFVVDSVNPSINLFSPLNNSWINSNFILNLSYWDLYLWRTNTTIYNTSDNKVLYTNYSGNLSGYDIYYNITQTLNANDFGNGRFRLLAQAVDTHTAREFKEDLVTIDEVGKTIYKLSKGDIEFNYPNDMNIDTNKEIDRFTQTFNSAFNGRRYFNIKADKIDYLSNSEYPCHFIINDAYWYDCIGLNNPDIATIRDNEYRIDFTVEERKAVSRSLGGLNNATMETFFNIDLVSPSVLNNVSNVTHTKINFIVNMSELVYFTYKFGTDCNGVFTNLGYDKDFSIEKIGLTNNTAYFFNITATDNASNVFTDCINISTAFYNDSIVVITVEIDEISDNYKVLLVMLFWILLFVFAFTFHDLITYALFLIYTIVSSTYLYISTNFPKIMTIIIASFCIYYTLKGIFIKNGGN